MESENLTIIEQLEKLRITSSSEIPPHEFLYTWNGVPCYARGELVAVTGKAKSGKTYLNSILMATAGLEPASNAGLMQTLLINGRREYLLQRQQKLFDEVPVRLVLLAPL